MRRGEFLLLESGRIISKNKSNETNVKYASRHFSNKAKMIIIDVKMAMKNKVRSDLLSDIAKESSIHEKTMGE